MRKFRAIIIVFSLQLFTLLIVPNAASSQSSEEIKKIFAQAESYFLYEEYELANQLYILLESPDNINIKFKIGTCYLNIPVEKEKSISYLEEAVKSASYDSKTETFKEIKAPLDAFFSLAKAYMINNELEKGLATLHTFQKLAQETKGKGGMENLEFIEQQIQACKNAIQFKEKPISFSKKSLGTDFSLGSINENPAVSYDGNTIVYTERRGIVNVLFFSQRMRGIWQSPIEITAELNAGEDCSSCSLNHNGTELFLYKTDTISLNLPLKLAGNYVPVTTALVPEKVASGKFISIKNVLFEYDSYKLSDDALYAIRELKSVLINYPVLKIEVAGYTDSKGTPEYNLKLADKRSQEIINFLSAEGIISPKTGVVIRQETYTPVHLIHSNSLKYCIVLQETKKNLTPESFANMKTEDVLFISSTPTDSLIYYTIGDFYNRTEALTYLNLAKENGFRNAYITDRYKLNSGSENIMPLETVAKPVRKIINESKKDKVYTIQVSASRKKLI